MGTKAGLKMQLAKAKTPAERRQVRQALRALEKAEGMPQTHRRLLCVAEPDNAQPRRPRATEFAESTNRRLAGIADGPRGFEVFMILFAFVAGFMIFRRFR